MGQCAISSPGRSERSLDLPGVTAFMLTEKDEPLVEIELAEAEVFLLDLSEREPAR